MNNKTFVLIVVNPYIFLTMPAMGFALVAPKINRDF